MSNINLQRAAVLGSSDHDRPRRRAVVRRSSTAVVRRQPENRVIELVPAMPRVEDLWLAALKAANRSPHTLASYKTAVEQFKKWRGEGDLLTVTRAEAYGYVQYLTGRYQPGGVAIRIRSLRALWGWLVKEEIIERNPWRGINITVPDDPHLTATDEQVAAMLASAKSSKRDHALLWILVSSGARKNEVANLLAADVNVPDGLITFRVSKTRARTIPLSDHALVALGRWLRQRGAGAGSLWSSPRRPIERPYDLTRAVVARHSGGELTPHSLRRAAAVRALSKGMSVPSIERLFGWAANSGMVARYVADQADVIAADEFRRLLG